MNVLENTFPIELESAPVWAKEIYQIFTPLVRI